MTRRRLLPQGWRAAVIYAALALFLHGCKGNDVPPHQVGALTADGGDVAESRRAGVEKGQPAAASELPVVTPAEADADQGDPIRVCKAFATAVVTGDIDAATRLLSREMIDLRDRDVVVRHVRSFHDLVVKKVFPRCEADLLEYELMRQSEAGDAGVLVSFEARRVMFVYLVVDDGKWWVAFMFA